MMDPLFALSALAAWLGAGSSAFAQRHPNVHPITATMQAGTLDGNPSTPRSSAASGPSSTTGPRDAVTASQLRVGQTGFLGPQLCVRDVMRASGCKVMLMRGSVKAGGVCPSSS